MDDWVVVDWTGVTRVSSSEGWWQMFFHVIQSNRTSCKSWFTVTEFIKEMSFNDFFILHSDRGYQTGRG